ncbi:hypothetical protein ACWKT5_21675 [Streptomyces avermitilis]
MTQRVELATAMDRLRVAQDGITEIVYQPTGPDIPGELERFIAIASDVQLKSS